MEKEEEQNHLVENQDRNRWDTQYADKNLNEE
jgi:hypothetical protein